MTENEAKELGYESVREFVEDFLCCDKNWGIEDYISASPYEIEYDWESVV